MRLHRLQARLIVLHSLCKTRITRRHECLASGRFRFWALIFLLNNRLCLVRLSHCFFNFWWRFLFHSEAPPVFSEPSDPPLAVENGRSRGASTSYTCIHSPRQLDPRSRLFLAPRRTLAPGFS